MALLLICNANDKVVRASRFSIAILTACALTRALIITLYSRRCATCFERIRNVTFVPSALIQKPVQCSWAWNIKHYVTTS